MIKHTPIPWRCGDAGHTVFGPPNGHIVPHVVAGGLWPGDTQLIVRAVNCHASLVSACEAICDCECNDPDWGSVEWCESVGQAIEQARVALTLVKEGRLS